MLQCCSRQGASSCSGPSQAFPSAEASCSTFRDRFFEPSPQRAGQSDQSLQLESAQSLGSEVAQGPVLHGWMDSRLWLPQLPPELLGSFNSLRRIFCPPPQILSHADHRLQPEMKQSWACGLGQPAVSWSPGGQGLPPGPGAEMMRRWRNCWRWPVSAPTASLSWQPPQSVQALTWQPVALHGSSVHVSVAVVAPRHGSPPDLASTSMRRDLVRRPSPHVALHSDQACQAEKLQAIGCGPRPQALVILVEPIHDWPSGLFSCAMERERVDWSRVDAHLVQADHAEKLQSCSLFMHLARMCLSDSIFGPSQGLPHSLFETFTPRWRKRMPVQPPAENHSPQLANVQSTGEQGKQVGNPGQTSHCSSKPEQTWTSAFKGASGLEVVRGA
mmetsp:Transcript_69357/g.125056  ORF Transcript_69357/g.125056 Transcript_69357/m.125056 type:complete len:387 (+) Transcript_69357:3447-4607(+)